MVQSRNWFFLFFLPVSIRSLLYSLSGKELIQSQRCYQNCWKDVNSGSQKVASGAVGFPN